MEDRFSVPTERLSHPSMQIDPAKPLFPERKEPKWCAILA